MERRDAISMQRSEVTSLCGLYLPSSVELEVALFGAGWLLPWQTLPLASKGGERVRE